METFIKIAQFLLSLTILVTLHELGHFTFAKLFKTRIEKFYIFFNPVFSLFKFKYGETEYGIGWIPLGGYVKISGMIDESMDTKQMKQEPKPYEFRSKPAWQRLIIMVAGVFVNILLAFVIYIAVLYTWGEEYLPTKNVKNGVLCTELIKSIGVQDGDMIYALDNKDVERFSEIIPNIILNNPSTLQVIRDGRHLSIDIPTTLVPALLEQSSKNFDFNPAITPRISFGPYIIASFGENSSIKKAGAMLNDELISVDGIEFKYADEFTKYMHSVANKAILVKVLRDGKEVELHTQLDGTATLGIYGKARKLFDTEIKKYTLLESIPAGINLTINKISTYFSSLKLMFNGETKAYKSVGGFISIGNIFPGVWNWHAFWNLTAFLSVILGVMNLLPIPALDGGHVMFLLYEIIARRKPGEKFMEYAQITGMLILFSLLILAQANDIIKLLN
jgi:regulator of sigma E protease